MRPLDEAHCGNSPRCGKVFRFREAADKCGYASMMRLANETPLIPTTGAAVG